MVTSLCLQQTINSVKHLGCSLKHLSSAGLAPCFTEGTTAIFDVVHLNGKEKTQSFLLKDPKERCDDPSYQGLRMAVPTMGVVNDSAERIMASIQKHNKSLIKNEEQKQFPLRQGWHDLNQTI